MVLVFSLLWATYMANGKTLGSGDTLPARYLPLSILENGNFYLDAFPFLYDEHARYERIGELPYYVIRVKGHYVSRYPVGAALVAVPVYAPAVLWGITADSPVVAQLEKLSAAVVVALSAVVLYIALLRLTSRRVALAIIAVYGLGTSSLSISSQALWQHGPSQLALAATLYGLARGRAESRWVAAAGFPLAFAVIARPSDALVGLSLTVYVLRRHTREALGLFLSALPPIAFQLWYNLAYFGDPFQTQFPIVDPSVWRTPLWEGLTGLLLSPGRGLLIYSPVLVLSGIGMARAWRRGGDPLVRALGLGAVLTILVYGKWFKWWGGYTYGPRLLADLGPVLAVCLVPAGQALARHRAWQVVFAIFGLWSVLAHAVGAFWDDHLAWNSRFDIDRRPEHVWLWTDNQLANGIRELAARALAAAGRGAR